MTAGVRPIYVIEVRRIRGRGWEADVLQDISVIGEAAHVDATTAVLDAMASAGKSRLGKPFAKASS